MRPNWTISIHALRVEGDKLIPKFFRQVIISIHALRVEGDALRSACRNHRQISIHALRVEGDYRFNSRKAVQRYFYPRPPGGGRLFCRGQSGAKIIISIHALRVEGD